MRFSAFALRFLGLGCLALLAQACEGPQYRPDMSGQTNQFDEWAPIETAQLTGNVAEVLSGLPLKDAKRTLRNNGTVQHDIVTITDRGWATAERIASPGGYFDIPAFVRLGSREAFEDWLRQRFPRAKNIEIIDIIPVTHPRTATRGHVGTVVVTNPDDRSFRCALSYSGYGGPRLSETSTDIFRLEELKSTLRVRLCTTNASAALLNRRLQRVAF